MTRIKSAGRLAVLFAVFTGIVGHIADDTRAEPKSQSRAGSKKTLNVAISPDIPPYVMQKATNGLEVDIVRSALAGYEVRFIQIPYAELQTAIPQKRADVSVGVQVADDGACYSENFITFANYAISKKSDGLRINRVADLKNHPVGCRLSRSFHAPGAAGSLPTGQPARTLGNPNGQGRVGFSCPGGGCGPIAILPLCW